MLRKTWAFAAAILIPFCVIAEELQLAADHPQSYVVQEGDTLWDISGRFLTEPWRWPELWKANPQIENPDLIYPGDVLTLSYSDGRPGLQVGERGGTAGDRSQKLSPQVREYRREDVVHAIPLDAIRQFLSRPRVVGPGQLEAAPYVVAGGDDHIVNGAGDRVYVRGIQTGDTTRFSVFRSGDVYRDPDAGGRIIGYEALHVGDAVVERFGDPATARIIRSNREVLIGDRLMPQTEDKYPHFVPHAPDNQVSGRIISVIDGVSEIGQHQIVVLNRGDQDGLEPGHVLGIFQAGRFVSDPIRDFYVEPESAGDRAIEGEGPITDVVEALNAESRKAGRLFRGEMDKQVELPEERMGELMVFRTFDNVSYGLVMNIRRPAHMHDAVRNP
jgi:hypothetical protein